MNNLTEGQRRVAEIARINRQFDCRLREIAPLAWEQLQEAGGGAERDATLGDLMVTLCRDDAELREFSVMLANQWHFDDLARDGSDMGETVTPSECADTMNGADTLSSPMDRVHERLGDPRT